MVTAARTGKMASGVMAKPAAPVIWKPRKLVLKSWMAAYWSALRALQAAPAWIWEIRVLCIRVTLLVAMPSSWQAAVMTSAGMPRM